MIDSLSRTLSKQKDDNKLIYKNRDVKDLTKFVSNASFYDVNYIDFSGNKLIAIPDDISKFVCLEALFCSHNNIRSLSSKLNNLMYLETLDLSCNQLTSLHPSICKLECLKILLISSNRLVSLPKNISFLKCLEELDASCNSLTCLPEELSLLKKLKFLNLRHNKLLDVPIGLSTLTIEVLDLSENQLSSIPCEYHQIETLQSFNLFGNPLTSPPANVCNRGLFHIMKYLQSESRRLKQRQHIKLGSQISTDYSTLNNNQITDSIHFDMNHCDSTSTISFPSAIDLDQEFDNGFQETSKYQYLPPSELIQQKSLNRRDSGYNTITNSARYDFMEKLNATQQQQQQQVNEILSNSTIEYSDTVPLSPPYRDEIAKTSERMMSKQFKKNKNYSSTSTPITQAISPQTYRCTRFNPRNRISEPLKTRRNSLPSNEFVENSNNFANHDVDISSECVVVVDNNESGTSPNISYSSTTQANNNNSSSFNKISYSSLRHMKSKSSESNSERNPSLSRRVNGIIPEQDTDQNSDAKRKRLEAIKRFHKIIEAQLHVQINFKDLSQELSNGIYLCHLAKILIPNCIPIVHTASPGQRELGKQKSKRNLENFLETCRRNGVSEDNLFSPRDVINCNSTSLYQLAKSVDSLMQSIRVKKSRQTSSCKPWREVLANPQSLSERHSVQYKPQLSLSNSNTIYRLNKSINSQKFVKSKSSNNDDIIQYSSEV